MPGHDGTGPRGLGPMTGKGNGYCVIRLPENSLHENSPEPGLGFVGLPGRPVRLTPCCPQFEAMAPEVEAERIRSALLAIEQDLSDLEVAAQRLRILDARSVSEDCPAPAGGLSSRRLP